MSTDSPFAAVWAALTRHVEAGQLPGCVAGISRGGQREIFAAGTLTLDGNVAMAADTIFRIASLSKLIGAVLALRLVQDGVFSLADPVAGWLPELAEPAVLVDPGAELTDTVPADRAITIRDLLTMTYGHGLLMDESPLATAMNAAGIAPGPLPPAMSHDEYLARTARLPLAFQPGDGWLYHNGTDVLSVLMARATGRSLSELLAEHLTGPLGMTSTGFFTRELDRFAVAYQSGPAGLEVFDPADGAWSQPPAFDAFASGLVSTVEDYLAFLDIFSNAQQDVLSTELLTMMTSDCLTDTERASAQLFLGEHSTWGLNVEISTISKPPWQSAGAFGWGGGTGTTAMVDPVNDLTAVLFTQRMLDGPTGSFDDFFRALNSCR